MILKEISILKVFEEINAKDIRYFHFKSNAHLSRSFEGKTDFDLLVHKNDAHEFVKTITALGFKKRVSTFDKFYFGMEDFLLYDAINDQTHHFHIHYDLFFGKRFSKNFKINNVEYWFENVIWHHEYPIKIITPELELVLLLQRIVLKYDDGVSLKSLARLLLNKKYSLPKNIRAEVSDLKTRCDIKKLNAFLDDKYSEVANILFKVLENTDTLTSRRMFLLKARLKRRMSDSARIEPKINSKYEKIRKTFRGIESRSLANNGVFISIVGADGAGKTTLAHIIHKWLSYKLTTKIIYLGKPKKRSFKLRTIYVLTKLAKGFKMNTLSRQLRDLVFINIAKTKKKKIIQAKHLSQRGCIVISDRYPLKEFWKMNEPMDGPKLPSGSKHYKREREIFSSLPDYPDLTIILKVSIDESIKRKPAHNNPRTKKLIEDKIAAINELDNVPNAFIFDSSGGIANTVRQVKSTIWNNL